MLRGRTPMPRRGDRRDGLCLASGDDLLMTRAVVTGKEASAGGGACLQSAQGRGPAAIHPPCARAGSGQESLRQISSREAGVARSVARLALALALLALAPCAGALGEQAGQGSAGAEKSAPAKPADAKSKTAKHKEKKPKTAVTGKPQAAKGG